MTIIVFCVTIRLVLILSVFRENHDKGKYCFPLLQIKLQINAQFS